MYRDKGNAEDLDVDAVVVLDAAVRSFWSKGYRGTSVQQISRSVGIEPGRIYKVFGDKRRLFREVLIHHMTHHFAERMLRMGQLPPREAIASFLAEIVERSLHDEYRKGCLLVNSAIEVAREDRELNDVVAEVFTRMEGFFHACIERGQASGEIARHLSSEDLARMFLGTLLGILVLAKTKPERPLLEGMVRQAMATLNINPAWGFAKSDVHI